MINFVVATHTESLPIIKFYNLKQIKSDHMFQVFRNVYSNIFLIITGIGKIRSASATMYLYGVHTKLKNQIWINIGICGHKNYSLGNGYLVNKITDKSSNQNFYPIQAFSHNFFTSSCITCDKPNINYCKSLYDMESSGFFCTALKFSTSELIHLFKIISDNETNKINIKEKPYISGLIKDNLNLIDTLVKKLKMINKINYRKTKCQNDEIEKQYFYFCKNFDFNKNEQCELKNVLEDWNYLENFESPIKYLKIKKISKEEILKRLRNKLKHD